MMMINNKRSNHVWIGNSPNLFPFFVTIDYSFYLLESIIITVNKPHVYVGVGVFKN